VTKPTVSNCQSTKANTKHCPQLVLSSSIIALLIARVLNPLCRLSEQPCPNLS